MTVQSNGKALPIIGTLVAILLSTMIGTVGYMYSRLEALEERTALLQAQQAATQAMANARLDAVTLTAARIERQVDILILRDNKR